MKHDDYTNAVPSYARNELFYFFARACMIIASVVGLPSAGFMMTRIISQNDAMQSTIVEQSVTIKVLSATVKDKLDANVLQLTDHELRLRALERRNPT